jgi:hypothetical protein
MSAEETDTAPTAPTLAVARTNGHYTGRAAITDQWHFTYDEGKAPATITIRPYVFGQVEWDALQNELAQAVADNKYRRSLEDDYAPIRAAAFRVKVKQKTRPRDPLTLDEQRTLEEAQMYEQEIAAFANKPSPLHIRVEKFFKKVIASKSINLDKTYSIDEEGIGAMDMQLRGELEAKLVTYFLTMDSTTKSEP